MTLISRLKNKKHNKFTDIRKLARKKKKTLRTPLLLNVL